MAEAGTAKVETIKQVETREAGVVIAEAEKLPVKNYAGHSCNVFRELVGSRLGVWDAPRDEIVLLG